MDAKDPVCVVCGKADKGVTLALVNNGSPVWYHPDCARSLYEYAAPRLEEYKK